MTKTADPKAVDVKRAYFDAEPMLGTGWPNINTRMQNILFLARSFSVEVVLPLAVEDQLVEHRVREYIRKQQTILSHIDDLNTLTSNTDITLTAPSKVAVDRLRETLLAKWATAKQQFQSAPYTQRPLTDFFGMAIRQEQPFGEEGKGFQDAVILSSVLQHLQQSPVAGAVFISRDKDFGKTRIAELAKAAGTELECFNLEQLGSQLEKRLKANVEEHWRQDKQRLRAILVPRMSEIVQFIQKNLEVPTGELAVLATSLGGFMMSYELGCVLTPLPDPNRKPGDAVTVSFDVTMKIQVPQFSFGFAQTTVPLSQLLTTRGAIVPKAGTADIATLSVEVEANATVIENGYSDVNFCSARVKQPLWKTLSAMSTQPPGEQTT
jgi:hypothetical protein